MVIDETRPITPTTQVMSFHDFKRGPALRVMAAVGHEWLTLLREAQDYGELRDAVIRCNMTPNQIGRFSKAVRKYTETCSQGEWTLVTAIAALCDFAELADELAGDSAWRNLTNCHDREIRRAVAACIVNS